MPVTFAVHDVQQAPHPPKFSRANFVTPLDFVKASREDVPLHDVEFLTSSFAPNASSVPFFGITENPVAPTTIGLFDSVITAYSGHHHLVLRPDDLWLCILSALSLYVNANAKRMRHHFVAHEGQKPLVVYAYGNRYNAQWDSIVGNLNEQIKDNLKDASIQSWLSPNFTTTTATDVIAAKVSVMSIMSKYFQYKVNFLCGIPLITLAGEREDWVLLREKLDRLSSFEEEALTKWHHILIPIFDGFVKAFNGEVDVPGHWSHMIKYDDIPNCVPTRVITGWIAYLAPFTASGAWRYFDRLKKDALPHTPQLWLNWTGPSDEYYRIPLLDDDEIPLGTVNVPLIIDDNGVQFDGFVVAGVVGSQWKLTEQAIAPYVGWALYTVPKPLVLPQGEPDGMLDQWFSG